MASFNAGCSDNSRAGDAGQIAPQAADASAKRRLLEILGQPVRHIHDHGRIELDSGLIVLGDARLVEAVRGDSLAIARAVMLEIYPPVLVVTFGNDEVRRYYSIAP